MKNLPHQIIQKVMLIAFLCFSTGFISYSQNYNATVFNNGNSSFSVSGFPEVICEGGGFINTTDVNCSGTCLENILNGVSQEFYHVMGQGQTINFGVSMTTSSFFDFQLYFVDYVTNIGTPNETSTSLGSGSPFCVSPPCTENYTGSITPPLGGLNAIVIRLTGVGAYILPLAVTGPISTEVPILYSTRTPILPRTIIYDPPGDGSSSSWNISTEFCQDYSTSVATSSGFSNNTDITLGVEGSIGFIATVDFAFGATFSGGFGITKDRTSETSFENCITISQTFQTSNLDSNIGAPADLIVGISEYQNYGLGDVVKIDGCGVSVNKKIFVWSDPSQALLSVMTEELIHQDIASLQNVINAGVGASSPEIVTEAENQIDVWNQVLVQKADNEANATYETSFTAPTGSTTSQEIGFSATQSSTINYQTVVDGNVGLEVFANIGGTGASNTTEMTWQDTYGQGTSTTNGSSEINSYEIFDDEDNLMVDIYRDNVFGTPILRINPTSASSCPYEGGIRRDQPAISFNGNGCSGEGIKALQVTTDNTPVNFIFDLCNNATETRTYQLSLEGNNNNATVTEGGTALNNTFGVTNHTITTGACKQVTVNVNGNGNTNHSLSFLLSPECGGSPQKEEADQAFLDISFIVGATYQETEFCNDGDMDGLNYQEDLCPNVPDIAIDFDGTDDYIEVPHIYWLNLVDGDFAFQAWVNPRDDVSNTIVSKGDGLGAGNVFIYNIYGGVNQRKQGLYLYANGTGQWLLSNTGVPLDTWSHVAVSFDWATQTATFFLNGVMDGQVVFPESTNFNNIDTNPLYIGKQGWQCDCNYFNGLIDDVLLWDKALTEQDITKSMSAPLLGTEPSLISYYDFNDEAACTSNPTLTAMDKGVFNWPGTLTNFTPNGCSSNWVSGRNLDSDGDGLGDSCDCENSNLSNNLISYWSFDDTVEDLKGVNSGTLVGSGSSYAPAVFGNGIDLDGGNSYVNMGNHSSLNMTNKSMTISAWFRVDAFTDSWQTLMSKGEGANFRLARNAETDYMSYNGAFPDVVAPVNINDAQFHHVFAVTEHATYKEIYIDGVLWDTETSGVPITDGGLDFLIGNNPNILSRDWNGMIDDVAIWSTNLNACDAYFVYSAGMSLGDILGIPNVVDVCPGFPDNQDDDMDGTPDGCDTCPYASNPFDVNNNGICDLNDPAFTVESSIYDFENLNVGTINGQDNWNSNGTIINSSSSGDYIGSQALESDQTFTSNYRINDANWSFPAMNECTDMLVLEFDMIHGDNFTSNYTLMNRFQLGVDLNNNGFLESNELGLGMSLGMTQGLGLPYIYDANGVENFVGGNSYIYSVSFHTIRYRLIVDFKGNNGQGAASLYYNNLTLQSGWTPTEGNVNMDFDWASSGPDNPANLNGMYFYGFNVTGLDNISIDTYSDVEDLNMNGICDNLEGCLDNITIGNTMTTANTTYESSQQINSSQIIGATANVSYSAGQEISLEAGFEVILGAVFEAYIGGCTPAPLQEEPNENK